MAAEFGDIEDEMEFLPAAPGQITMIAVLTSEVLDGTVSLSGRRQQLSATHFESEFFQHQLARYSHDGTIVPIGSEEFHELLADSDRPLAGLPENAKNNHIGLALGLASGIDYDGGYMEISAPVDGGTVSYDFRPDSLASDPLELYRYISGMPTEADENQARILLNIVKLIALLDKTGSPAPMEERATGQIREEFSAFQTLDSRGRPPDPSTVAELKTQVLDVIDARSIRATFMRRFMGQAGTSSMVLARLKLDRDGQYSRHYEVQTRVPSTIDGFDTYVKSLSWGDGSELEHSAYFDTDLDKKMERKRAEDPGFSFTRDFGSLLYDTIKQRADQRRRFEEEKQQGFHEFSQADALRLIQTLENPGEEIRLE